MEDLSVIELGLKVNNIIKEYNSVLLVASRGTFARKTLTQIGLNERRNMIEWSHFSSNPDIHDFDSKLDEILNLKLFGKILIIAVGGGSAIDAAKALSVMFPNRRKIQEILTNGVKIHDLISLDILAIPTTAGSGSECTTFATIWDKKNSIKASLDLPQLKPKMKLYCSSLLTTLPADLLLYSALDARSHAVESFLSLNSNNESQIYAKKSIKKSLDKLDRKNIGKEVLINLTESSKFAGMAINISRTSLSHAISYPLTLHLGIPHGLAAGFTLRAVWKKYKELYNYDAKLREIIDKATIEVENLELAKHVKKYADIKKILEVIPLVKQNSRFDNFKVKVKDSDIKEIICDSLKF